jgi:hypothetical protein
VSLVKVAEIVSLTADQYFEYVTTLSDQMVENSIQRKVIALM